MAAPVVRGRTAPAAGLSATSPSATAVGDAVICFTWERTGAGSPTHTLQADFVEIISHLHDDAATDGRLSVAYKIATTAGATSYQAYTSSAGTDVWTGIIVLQTGTFAATATNKGLIASASTTQTNNAVPNPPSVTLGTARDWLAIVIAGWHLSSSVTVTPTAPTNYGNLQHIAGSALGELASAERALTAPASEDPGAFGDDVAPSGTAIVTIGVPSIIAQSGTVDVAGAGSVAASGVPDHRGTADVTGTGTVAASGVPARFGTADVTGTGSVAATGSRSVFGSAAIAGAGVVSASGNVSFMGSVAVAGAGTVSVVGRLGAFALGDVFGAGVVAATGIAAIFGVAAQVGLGSVSATGTRATSGQASVPGAGVASATGTLMAFGASDVVGVGSVEASGTVEDDNEAAVAGAGSVGASGVRMTFGAVLVTGSGSVGATGLYGAQGASPVVGVGSVSAVGERVALGVAALDGQGILEATGNRGVSGAASVVGVGTIIASSGPPWVATSAPGLFVQQRRGVVVDERILVPVLPRKKRRTRWFVHI